MQASYYPEFTDPYKKEFHLWLQKINIEEVCAANEVFEGGNTRLHFAAMQNDYRAVLSLLGKGAPVLKNEENKTPLEYLRSFRSYDLFDPNLESRDFDLRESGLLPHFIKRLANLIGVLTKVAAYCLGAKEAVEVLDRIIIKAEKRNDYIMQEACEDEELVILREFLRENKPAT